MKKRNMFIMVCIMALSIGLCACVGRDIDTAYVDTVVKTEVEESVTNDGEDVADVETTEIGIEENVEETVQST